MAPEVINVRPSKHSELGPSGSHRWIECPGSVLATRGMPSTAGIAAAEGHAAHALSELCRQLRRPALSYLGAKIRDGSNEFEVDNEMAIGVQGFVNYCEDEFGHPLIETLVKYTDWVPGGFGTMDDGRLNNDLLVLTDLKWGVTDGEGSYGTPVPAKDNSQLKLYGLGALQSFRHLDYDIKKFVLRIYQPRLDHEDQWEITTNDLLQWAGDVVVPAAKLALSPGAPFKAGPWCTFCKLRATCQVRAKSAFDAISADFIDLDAPKALAVIEQKTTEISTLSREQISRILAVREQLRKYLKEVERFAFGEIVAGRPVGAWHLTESRSNRTYDPTQQENAIAIRLKELGIPEDQLYKKKLISYPQAEQILGKKNHRLAALMHKPIGKPKLSDDPSKPAMAVSALTEFKDLGGNDDAEE